MPSSHILSPSRKNGTSELEELIVPPDYIQASPRPPDHPSSPGPASRTRRVGGCGTDGQVSNGNSKGCQALSQHLILVTGPAAPQCFARA